LAEFSPNSIIWICANRHLIIAKLNFKLTIRVL